MVKKLYLGLLEIPLGRRLARSLRASLLNALSVKDVYTDLVRLARSSEASLFLDIGCHEGRFAQRLLDAGLNLPVHGFDPIRENLEKAREVLAPCSGISLHELALSDQSGCINFHINQNRQTSSLLENDVGNIESFSHDVQRVEEREVRSMTLDQWAADNNLAGEKILIKCDVQGAEAMVIRGGTELFRHQVVGFLGEVMLAPMYQNQSSIQEIMERMDRLGFVLHYIYPCLLDHQGRATQTDILWIKKGLSLN